MVQSKADVPVRCRSTDSVPCRFQVADVPNKRKKGVFGTKGGDKEVFFSTLGFLQ